MRTKVVWFPSWACQNYSIGKSFGKRCPYCPYSLSADRNHLLFEGKETSPNQHAPAENLIAFFDENFDAMGGHLEVSGGEALMRQDIDTIFRAIQHRWAITSNTLNSTAIHRLQTNGSLKRCTSWTASWHPCSGMEKGFSHAIAILADAGVRPRVTVVIAKSTVDKLGDTAAFLATLPISGINWHLDSHGDAAGLLDRAERHIGKDIAALAGPPPQGKMCNKNGRLLAVGADGTLYPCVTFAYQNLHPICKVGGGVRLADLPERREWCGEVCFACCDHIKHES